MKRMLTILAAAAMLTTACVEDNTDLADPMRIGAFVYEQTDPVLSMQFSELTPVLALGQYLRTKAQQEAGLKSSEATAEQMLQWFLPGAVVQQQGNTWHITFDGHHTQVNTGGRVLYTDPEAVWSYNTDQAYHADALPQLSHLNSGYCRLVLPTQQNRTNFLTGAFTFSRSFLQISDLISGEFIGYAVETTTSGSGSVIAGDMTIGVTIDEELEFRSTDRRIRTGKLTLTSHDRTGATDVTRIEYGVPTTWVYYKDYYKEYQYEE